MPRLPDGSLQVGDAIAAPGSMAFGSIPCAYLPDATTVSIPVIVVNGAQAGPTLLLTSAMHGIEIGGTEVIRQLTRLKLDPKTLRGAVIAVPILNPFAFRVARMNTPQDDYNLNRVFPGGPDQLLSHRVADIILKKLVAECDFLVDFHSNVLPSIPFTIVRRSGSAAVDQASRRMAAAFGITTIEMLQSLEQHRTGTMSDCALADGKPSIVIELVDSRRIHLPAVAMGLRGTLNVMKCLGMIAGEINTAQTELPVHHGDFVRMEITANKGGLVHLGKEAGERVEVGDLLATLYDPFGDVVDEIRSPVAGYVLAYPLRELQAVGTGNMVVFLAFTKGDKR
jgi:uncharacterized protein